MDTLVSDETQVGVETDADEAQWRTQAKRVGSVCSAALLRSACNAFARSPPTPLVNTARGATFSHARDARRRNLLLWPSPRCTRPTELKSSQAENPAAAAHFLFPFRALPASRTVIVTSVDHMSR